MPGGMFTQKLNNIAICTENLKTGCTFYNKHIDLVNGYSKFPQFTIKQSS